MIYNAVHTKKRNEYFKKFLSYLCVYVFGTVVFSYLFHFIAIEDNNRGLKETIQSYIVLALIGWIFTCIVVGAYYILKKLPSGYYSLYLLIFIFVFAVAIGAFVGMFMSTFVMAYYLIMAIYESIQSAKESKEIDKMIENECATIKSSYTSNKKID